ncbi:hypothetical protein LTR66_017150, partial [Elasticomyces elasticus]
VPKPQPSHAVTPVSFSDFHVELYRLIARHLLPEEAAALGLCSKALYQEVFKQDHVGGLTIMKDTDRLKLLSLLHRDKYKTFMRCEICLSLHGVQYDRQYRRKCANQDRIEGSCHTFHPRFAFGNVQIASLLSQRGDPDLEGYLETLRLNAWLKYSDTLCAFDIKILHREVYIRRQEWYISLRSKSVDLQQLTLVDLASGRICVHITNDKLRKNHSGDIRLVEKSLRHLKVLDHFPFDHKLTENGSSVTSSPRDSSWASTEMWCCSKCGTEYRFDFGRMHKGQWFTVVLSKWMKLGDGASRLEGQWPRHCNIPSYGTRHVPVGGTAVVMKLFEDIEQVDEYKPEWTPALAEAYKRPRDLFRYIPGL